MPWLRKNFWDATGERFTFLHLYFFATYAMIIVVFFFNYGKKVGKIYVNHMDT